MTVLLFRYSGDPITLTATVRDATGTAVDLNGYTATADLRTSTGMLIHALTAALGGGTGEIDITEGSGTVDWPTSADVFIHASATDGTTTRTLCPPIRARLLSAAETWTIQITSDAYNEGGVSSERSRGSLVAVSSSGGGGAPSGPAGGDLGGTYPSPTVDGLQGRAVSSAAPASGEALVWGGLVWAPGAPAPGGAASGDLGGTYPSPTVTRARGLRETTGPTTLTMGAVADGQYLARSGTSVIGVAAPGGLGGISAGQAALLALMVS